MQVCPAATLPEYSTEVPPAAAVSVPPPQAFDALGWAATTMPPGNVSTKASAPTWIWLTALSMVNVSVETSPGTTLASEKALAKPGAAAASTVSVASARMLAPSDEVAVSVAFG